MKFLSKLSLIFYILIANIEGSDSPNFIFVLTDDQGWTSLSSAIHSEHPQAKSDYHLTPNIDKLIKKGMVFTDGYAASPVCGPTRYSIQFGKSPARLKYTKVGKNFADNNQIAIPQLLKLINDKYKCAHFGKWHIDADPSRYGYDLHDGITNNSEGGFTMKDSHREWGGYAEEDPKRVYSLTDKTIEFIKDSFEEDRPFFVQLSHYALHSNLVYSKESYNEMKKIKPGKTHYDLAYAAMVLDLDKAIGKLLNFYDEFNLSSNTYLIFTSDNGGMPILPLQVNRGRPYKNGYNSPLLRGKWDLMEGGIRVPFSVSGPGIELESSSAVPVTSYDLLPTILDIANQENISLELPKNLDGGSFYNVLFHEPDSKVNRIFDGLIFHFPHYNVCGVNEPHSAIRIGDYKLVKFWASNRSLLFNISKDIEEKYDLYDIENDKALLLETKLSDYLASVDAEDPANSVPGTKNNPFNQQELIWGKGEFPEVKTLFFRRYD